MATRYYRILGVSREATQHEIKIAYRRLVRELHPDKDGSLAASQRWHDVLEAYEVLSDPEARYIYDSKFETEVVVALKAYESSNGPTSSSRVSAEGSNDVSLTPPELHRSSIQFPSTKHGDDSIIQMNVKVKNKNEDQTLRLRLYPTQGSFWLAEVAETSAANFSVTRTSLEGSIPGTYLETLQVSWLGFPDVVTELPISLTILPAAKVEPPSVSPQAPSGVTEGQQRQAVLRTVEQCEPSWSDSTSSSYTNEGSTFAGVYVTVILVVVVGLVAWLIWSIVRQNQDQAANQQANLVVCQDIFTPTDFANLVMPIPSGSQLTAPTDNSNTCDYYVNWDGSLSTEVDINISCGDAAQQAWSAFSENSTSPATSFDEVPGALVTAESADNSYTAAVLTSEGQYVGTAIKVVSNGFVETNPLQGHTRDVLAAVLKRAAANESSQNLC